jgi:uncharacterized protein
MAFGTGTDSDWIVKLIDVYPADTPDHDYVQDGDHLSNYHQMVRSEVMRGKYLKSFSEPQPFTVGEITAVDFQLQDVLHTFKKGHKIQIQVQSTWFPLIDRNPQSYVDNIFKAEEEDFIKADHTAHFSAEHPSHVKVQILRQALLLFKLNTN